MSNSMHNTLVIVNKDLDKGRLEFILGLMNLS